MVKRLDNSLLLVLTALIGLGAVQVYSSSFIFASESFGDGMFFFRKQIIFVIISLAILITTALAPWKIIQKTGIIIWILALLGVAATFVPGLGVRAGGAIRWLQFPGGIRFEPAELMKLSFPLAFATLLVWKENQVSGPNFKVRAFLLLTPALMLLKQPDFGSFSIICAVGLGLLFAFGLPWKYIITTFTVSIPAFYLLVMNVPYRRARVMSFLDPWADPAEKGFQAIQSMLSFQTGGLTGVGLGQGQGKLFFLPEAHTDFTLAVFGEETGFIGYIILLSLYGFLVFRGFQIALSAQNLFRKASSLGISMVFGLSVFINIGVVIGLLPTKGLTLPFISYGGSSLLTFAFAFGILLNIERSERENSNVEFRPIKSFT